jgi:hypothetical protein
MTALTSIMAVVFRQVAELPAPAAEDWIRRHRLEPLVFGVPVEGVHWRDAFLDACRMSYARMAARAEQHRVAGLAVTGWLAHAGIPSLVWRGVEAGAVLYGDPALRYATDIDVMVRDGDAGRALAVLQARGCRLRSRNTPVWYLRRHHLHWAMEIMPGGVPLDVHWAVDHPYRTTAMPVVWDALTSPEGRLQMAIYHAEKESRLRGCGDDASGWTRVMRDGPLLPWIDIALMVGQVETATLDRVAAAMQSRGHEQLWTRTMAVVDRLRGRIAAEPAVADDVALEAAAWTENRAARAFARWLGCRPEALSDVVDYAVDGGPNRMMRWGRLVRLALDSVVCGLWIGMRSVVQRLRPGGVPC